MTGQDAHSTNNFRKSRRHAIFSAAVELPADQRDAYLVNEFANEPDMLEELRSLLKYHDTMSAPSDLPPTPLDDPLIGTTIGGCQIERRIGAGGMGIVYQATQSHPRRQVAVKVLRPGTMNQDMLARLDREAELLGRLCHPGIARIYGSSTFDTGQGATPYFIMEFIDRALPLTDYADQHHLDQRARVLLIAKICDALDHAHQRGVVHRDLKPGNILVDEAGNPRIIDFGVATTCGNETLHTTRLTRRGQLIGTLRYMSPEQVDSRKNSPDARTDVYGIGAVLYELLSGQPPFDLNDLPLPEAARLIREMPPRLLSSTDRTLRGDLETVCTTAMAKEPNRRYASAAAMASDLRRWLHFEPITARPPSMLYLTGRFVRRHRTPVTFASILIAVLTAALIFVSGSLARESEHRSQIEKEHQGLQQILAAVGSSLDAINHPETGEAPLTSLLREMTRQADRGIITEPLAEAAIRRMVAKSFHQSRRPGKAAEQLTAAKALYRSACSPENPDYQACLIDLAKLYSDLDDGIYDLHRASAYARKVLHTRETLYGPDDDRTMEAVETLGFAARDLGDGKESGELYERLITWLESQPSFNSQRLVAAMITRGFTLHRKGTYDQADVWYRKAADVASIHMEPTDPVRIEATTLRALTLRDRNRFDEAADIFDELLTDLIPLIPANRVSLLRECIHHGMVLARGGRTAEGMRIADKAIQRIEPHLPPNHPMLLLARSNRLKMLAWDGDIPAALRGAEKLWAYVDDSGSLQAKSIRGLGLQCSILLNDSDAQSRWQERVDYDASWKKKLIEAGKQGTAELLQRDPASGCSQLAKVLSIGIRLIEIGELESAVPILQNVIATSEAGRRPAWIAARARIALADALELMGQNAEASAVLAEVADHTDPKSDSGQWLLSLHRSPTTLSRLK
ncbi:MAG: protein kinase [Planctomycetes bacterium]|nr:protein kinase [Planctomycetota bacterium]